MKIESGAALAGSAKKRLRWGSIAAALAGVILSSAPARAQGASPAASLPDTTEVYLLDRLFPATPVTQELWRRFRANPIGGLLDEVLENQLHISLDRDLWSWFEGRAFAGWVRTGERSPMDVWYEYSSVGARYSEVEHALERLGAAADAYKEEHKRFPLKIDDILKDATVDPASFPGVQFSMKITPPVGKGPNRTPSLTPPASLKGGTWLAEIRADYDTQNQLSRYSTPPHYTLGKQEALVPGQRQAPPALGLVVGFESHSNADARHLLETLTRLGTGLKADAAGTSWSFDVADLHWTASSRAGWLLFSDQTSLIERFGAKGDGHSLEQSSRFQFQQAKLALPALPPGGEEKSSGFIDIQDIFEHTSALQQLGVTNPALSVGMRAWQIHGTTSVPREAHAQMFLHLAPKAGSPVAAWLSKPAQRSDGIGDLAQQIPWATNLVYALNLPEIVQLVEAFSKTDPVLAFGITAGFHQLETTLGVPLRYEQLTQTPGWASFYAEHCDSFAFGFRTYMLAAQGQTSSGSTGEDTTRKKAALGFAQEFPLSISVDIQDPDLYQKTLARLSTLLGPDAVNRQEGVLQWKSSKNGRLALAASPHHIYWANGHTERLLVRELKVFTKIEPSVAELDSFRQFQTGLSGRPIAFAHVKSDWVYSMMKGAILGLSADFRPEATALGQLRDTYLLAQVQPEGISLNASIYASEQVPEVKKH